MNLKDLKYLVALADTGHFGRAAARSFVSQPTLSAQLKKLEEYLGVKLVERQPRNVQLTEVGKQVVVRARRMLDDGEEIVALARSNSDPLAGKVRLAVILIALPTPLDGLESRSLYEEAFTVALPNNHPLAEKSTLRVQDLKGHTLLLLEDGHCLRDQALEVCGRVDVREAEDFRATSLETLRQMVVAGLGITLLPESAVEAPFGSQRGLAIRHFAKPAPTRSVGAVWRKSSTRLLAIAEICKIIERAMNGRD